MRGDLWLSYLFEEAQHAAEDQDTVLFHALVLEMFSVAKKYDNWFDCGELLDWIAKPRVFWDLPTKVGITILREFSSEAARFEHWNQAFTTVCVIGTRRDENVAAMIYGLEMTP